MLSYIYSLVSLIIQTVSDHILEVAVHIFGKLADYLFV